MVQLVEELPIPPKPSDSRTEFNQKASDVFDTLYRAVPQMNEQAQQIAQIGEAAVAAAETAIAQADHAMGYRNEARQASAAALEHKSAAAASAGAAFEHAGSAATDAARAETAAASAENRVPTTGSTGAALLPEGVDAQRPGEGAIPAGAAVMRGSVQTPGDYLIEFWNRSAAAWQALASRPWVMQAINTAKSAIENWVNGIVGFAIVYPNGGSEESPANVAINSRYVIPNPFPGHMVMCEAQLLAGGKWGSAGWSTTGNTTSSGILASSFDGDIVVQTAGDSLTNAGQWSGQPNPSIGGRITAPTPCRVLVRKLK